MTGMGSEVVEVGSVGTSFLDERTLIMDEFTTRDKELLIVGQVGTFDEILSDIMSGGVAIRLSLKNGEDAVPFIQLFCRASSELRAIIHADSDSLSDPDMEQPQEAEDEEQEVKSKLR